MRPTPIEDRYGTVRVVFRDPRGRFISNPEKPVSKLPERWQWLEAEPGPKILIEALKEYGQTEVPGPGNNPDIIAWADEIGGWIGDWYDSDQIPWCGLFIGAMAIRAGKPVSQKALSALSWAEWGQPSPRPALGDVLVLKRPGGGHVAIYVGEDADYYHVLGGNQSDRVNIMRIAKSRLVAARRFYRWAAPANVRPVFMSAEGPVSENEA